MCHKVYKCTINFKKVKKFGVIKLKNVLVFYKIRKILQRYTPSPKSIKKYANILISIQSYEFIPKSSNMFQKHLLCTRKFQYLPGI